MALILGALPLSAGETVEWTNNKGKKIEAELASYDFASKTVQLRKRNGSVGSVPLADLDSTSKLQALAQPPVSEVALIQLQNKGLLGFSLATGWNGLLMAAWFAFLCICALAAVLLPFKLAVMILASSDRDWIAYLKLMILGGVIETLILGGSVTSTFFSAQDEFDRILFTFSIAGTIFYFIVATSIIERHYMVGWFRAIGIQILYIVLAIIASPLIALVSLIPIAMTVGWVIFSIDPLILKPLDLI